jgi:hypothetical protein
MGVTVAIPPPPGVTPQAYARRRAGVVPTPLPADAASAARATLRFVAQGDDAATVIPPL